MAAMQRFQHHRAPVLRPADEQRAVGIPVHQDGGSCARTDDGEVQCRPMREDEQASERLLGAILDADGDGLSFPCPRQRGREQNEREQADQPREDAEHEVTEAADGPAGIMP